MKKNWNRACKILPVQLDTRFLRIYLYPTEIIEIVRYISHLTIKASHKLSTTSSFPKFLKFPESKYVPSRPKKIFSGQLDRNKRIDRLVNVIITTKYLTNYYRNGNKPLEGWITNLAPINKWPITL